MNTSQTSIQSIFKRAFDQKPDKPYIVFENEKLTYGELKKRVGQFSSYFKTLNISHGDRVAFSSKDELFVCSFYASLLANGITALIIDSESGAERAGAILKHSKPKYVFADQSVINEWEISSDDKSTVVPVVSVAKKAAFRKLLKKQVEESNFPALVYNLDESAINAGFNHESDAYILFTSGTTSAPKGVRISYRALINHMEMSSAVYQIENDSKFLNNLILSHADGMIQGPLVTLFKAATLYRPIKFSIQHIEDIFDIIYRDEITHWLLVPTMLSLIYQFKQSDSDTLEQNHFKFVISCGGKLESNIWQNFKDKFKTQVILGYGLTETVADCIFAGHKPESDIIGTIGTPESCEVKIMGEDFNEKLQGEKGEIWLKSNMIMTGYLNNPKANNAVFYDDWFRTGDIAYLGEDGCYRITGRMKNVIISGGVNISPEEISEVLSSCKGVQDAVTFGTDDKIWGETVTCAIKRNDLSLKKETIIAYCRKHLEERKVPTKIFFVDEFPRGRSGKIIIDEVKKKVLEEREKSVEGTDLKNLFFNIVANCFQLPVSEIKMDLVADHTVEWDSIAHLVLVAEIEKNFNITFSPLEVMNINTLADLYLLIEKKNE